jgi:hypothetical protein
LASTTVTVQVRSLLRRPCTSRLAPFSFTAQVKLLPASVERPLQRWVWVQRLAPIGASIFITLSTMRVSKPPSSGSGGR